MSSPTCYFTPEHGASDYLFKPCGPPSSTGFVQCCGMNGDVCGSNNFCRTTHRLVGGSGYYLAGCTDPAFKDPSCSTQRFGAKTYDVIFNSSTGLWACCSSPVNGPGCSSPSNVTFQALSPGALFETPFSILTASTTQSIATSRNSFGFSTTNQVATATITVINQVDSSSGLDTGAKASVGMGVAVIVIMASLGILLLWRRRSRRQQQLSGRPSFEQGLGVACDTETNSSTHRC